MWITLSGPSGAGKSTLLRHLISNGRAVALPSYTTRAARPSDQLTDYYRFVTRAEYLAMREDNEFVLEDEVCSNLYGTAKSDLLVATESSDLYVADFTVASVLEACKIGLPPILAAVLFVTERTAELRMRGRGDSEHDIASRNSGWTRELCNAVELAALYGIVTILDASVSPLNLADELMRRLRLIVSMDNPSAEGITVNSYIAALQKRKINP